MSQPLILGSTAVQHLDPFAPPRGPQIDPAIFERLPIRSAEPFPAPRLRLVVDGEMRLAGTRVAYDALPAKLRLTRRGKVVVVVLVALVLMALALGAALASLPAGASTGSAGHVAGIDGAIVAAPAATVVVQPGDTLWSIATRLGPNADPRRTVDAIIAANHLSGAAVQAGQRLVLP